MDKNLVEKYRKDMINMYVGKKQPVNAKPVQNITSENSESEQSEGYLIAIVSAVKALYPVPNAKVTVFTGNYNDMQIVDTKITDSSGRTTPFTLTTPLKELSQQADENTIPYSTYNMLVEAEGYLDNIHLNIPVFSSVTSLQRSNMMLLETAGTDKGPQVFDEGQKYNL